MTTAILDRARASPPSEFHVRSDEHPRDRGVLGRLWDVLAELGERRAAADVARYVRLMGGHPTGNLHRDVEQIVALRGLR
jgi:hypothetical protein